MNRNIGIGIGVVLVAGAAFAGGYYLPSLTGADTRAGANGPGGAFAQLTDAERQQLQGMTDEQRQAFFEEKGIDMPAGGPGGATAGAASGTATGAQGGQGGPDGGTQFVEGTVASYSDGKMNVTIASGGSSNVYVDDSTIVASVDGKSTTITTGSKVAVTSRQEAAGVSAALSVVIE